MTTQPLDPKRNGDWKVDTTRQPDPSRTALLVMDVQQSMVERFAGGEELAARLGTAVAAARRAGVTIIAVRVAFRPGHPEVDRRNKMFGRLAESGALILDSPEAALHPALGIDKLDPVVTKVRVGAFAGSDLAQILRGRGITTLVLGGIATSGVVLSTLRHAADADHDVVVLADGCLDADPEVHRVLVSKVFPAQAEVVTVAEWIGQLGTGGHPGR